MTSWTDLREDLRRLREEAPGALTVFPDPDSDCGRAPPISVDLAAWATGIAAELHQKHGTLVDLQVGALSFPDRSPRVAPSVGAVPGLPAESVGLRVESQTTFGGGHWSGRGEARGGHQLRRGATRAANERESEYGRGRCRWQRRRQVCRGAAPTYSCSSRSNRDRRS